MPRTTIRRLRGLVRSLNDAVSIHAAEELDDDNLTILDLENTILTGHITGRQKDRDPGESRIVVRGDTLDGRLAETVIKIGPSGTLFVITVYVI